MTRYSLEQSRKIPFHRTLDYWLLLPILGICAISVYVLSFILPRRLPSGYPRNLIVQIVAILIGFVVMLMIAKLGVDKLRLVGWATYILALGLQLLLPFLGDHPTPPHRFQQLVAVPIIVPCSPRSSVNCALHTGCFCLTGHA